MSFLKYKFLLDENVRHELYQFLKKSGVDVAKVPKGLKNGKVARLSLEEDRILVTNDGDFAYLSSGAIYGIIWLRLSQNDAKGLIHAFEGLLTKPNNFEGKLVTIQQGQVAIVKLANK